MKGSFGNEKKHYGLERLRQRARLLNWFGSVCGVLTANAVKIAKRRKEENQKMVA